MNDQFGKAFTVTLQENTCSCSCNIPLLQKLPCLHVMAACARTIGGANRSYYDFCSMWFSVENYKASYAPSFHPIPDSRYWDAYHGPTILPPPTKRKTGRPRSTRIKGMMNKMGGSKQNTCSKCGQKGHKRSTCPSK